jgi:hypothetical protein
MKYLKRFNEELDPQTYKRAARKLRKLGHEGRAKELEDWSNKRQIDEGLLLWKENVKRFSKFGKFKLNIKNPKTDEKLTGDFYLDLILDRDSFGESLQDFINDKKGSFWIAGGIIPANEETLNKCMVILPDPDDLNNGFFWALSLSLDFIIESNTIKFNNYELSDYDSSLSGNVSIADRASANRLRILLKNMFGNPNYDYPSGYRDFDNFYEMVWNVFGAQYGLSSDYGFSPELITDFINSMSPNEMYKSI